MAKDSKTIGLIEDLFSRSKGLRSTYDRLERLSTDALGAIANIASIVSLRAVQGVDVLTNDYHTEMAYLDAIWRKVSSQTSGTVPPAPLRRVILPGDNTNYMWFNPVPNGAVFPSFAFGGLAAPYDQLLSPAAAFSTNRPVIYFGGLPGAIQTAESWGFGYVRDNSQIIELNASFVLPTGSGRATAQYQRGFGMVNMPLTEPSAVGVWVEPDLNIGGALWGTPYPIKIYIATGNGSPTAYSVPDIHMPASDVNPGAIAISWNRYRIAVYLSRGYRGLSQSAAIPRYWLYPYAPNAWPYAWPYIQQQILMEVGNPTYYPGITSGTIPAPVAAHATWNPFYLNVREIDIEETPIYPGTPLAGAINPTVLKIEI